MPKGLLQEKFQRTVTDPQTDGGNSWGSFKNARRTSAIPEGRVDTSEAKKRNVIGGIDAAIDYPKSNRMPPGQEINDQYSRPGKDMPYVAAGATDVSNSVNGSMLKKGFQRQDMKGTDDMYTNEHTEEFYGEAKGEDDAGNKYTGFLERNNYLDRN